MAEQNEPKKDVYRPPTMTTVVGSILGLATVVVMILVMVWVSRPVAPAPAPDEAAPRTLEEVEAEEARLLGSYEWMDREAGVVRIPIERAMELVILEAGRQVEQGPGSETEAR
jgi:hypothetical protein